MFSSISLNSNGAQKFRSFGGTCYMLCKIKIFVNQQKLSLKLKRMHQKRIVYLLCLVAISPAFILFNSSISLAKAHTPLKTNHHVGARKNGHNTNGRDGGGSGKYKSDKMRSAVNNTANSGSQGESGNILVGFRKYAPTFKENIFVREHEIQQILGTIDKTNTSESEFPVSYYSFLGGKYNLMNPLWADQIKVMNTKETDKPTAEYIWMNDKYVGPFKTDKLASSDCTHCAPNSQVNGTSAMVSDNIRNYESYKLEYSTDTNVKKVNTTKSLSEKSSSQLKNNDIFKYSGFQDNKSKLYKGLQARATHEFKNSMNITLSNSDPIGYIQEKDNVLPNIRWSKEVFSEIPSNFPEKIVNFEYHHSQEQESSELDGKEGALLKEFVRLAVDFSFLSGSSLNGAVCMYKAVLPFMKIRWRSLKSIGMPKMDTILKVMLGIPFFRYFEEKENMISSCINMFIKTDMDSAEGLCLRKSRHETSIMGISIADFKIDQYYDNKLGLIKENDTLKENNELKPHDPANLIEMIYDDVCNYFYECMDEDISDELNEYIFQNTHIFDVMENQRMNFFKTNQVPLFPDTSERKSSVDALPSDWFLASLQQLSQMNAEMPELALPGMNIRDIGRLYFYAGRIGLQLPVRITLKMMYELSVFANHSPLLRRAFCTESLLKLVSFKIADVLCKVSFLQVPLKFKTEKLYTSLKELLHLISFATTAWKKRPDPICSEAEVIAQKSPNMIYPPHFVQYYSVRDNWSLYRSLAIQLYGNIAINYEESTYSVVSMIHSLVSGYIKLNWNEFRGIYAKVGIVDPENYYSLLISQRRGPGLIELIAFSRVYGITVQIYKKILRNSTGSIYFELDEEITALIQNLGEVEYTSIEIYNKVSIGNISKAFKCKVLRLVVDKKLPGGFSEGVFKLNISNYDENINGEIKDGSNWTWDAILPVYDAETNEKILSSEIGTLLEYKSIKREQNFTNNTTFNTTEDWNIFPPFEVIQDKALNCTEYKADWRKPTNRTFGRVLLSTSDSSIDIKDSTRNSLIELDNLRKLNDSTHKCGNKHSAFNEYTQYNVVVMPLISFYQAGVYESRMFMNKIFEESQYFNWDDLPRRLDLEYLQSIIYVGDVYKSKKNLEIDSWKPAMNKNNIINIFPENKMNSEIDPECSEELDLATRKENATLIKNESNANIEVASENNSTLSNDNCTAFAQNNHFEADKVTDCKYDEYNIQTLPSNSGNILRNIKDNPSNEPLLEFGYIVTPTMKPWNNFVNLPENGFMNNEPEFSFIPFNGGPILPKKNEDGHAFKLDMGVLFNLAKEFWMLPLLVSSRSLYCFGKHISPFLNNPNPSYIPQMLIYDRVISTVVSLLPVVDATMSKLRPLQFVITVCEMALLDPIDLDPFLVISKSNTYLSEGTVNSAPSDLLRIFGQMPAIRNICASVANCIHSPNFGNEYKSLINQISRSESFNQYTPNSEQIILIQKLVPRFPEIVVIIRNLLRMTHFIGRKGIFLDTDTLYQIAKELSIAFHSISPYLWKSQINLNEIYEAKSKSSGLRQTRHTERNFSFIPAYDEAYWGFFDRELLLFTCASILTSRGALTLITALVVCHYSFLRVPLSKKILSTIPDSKDLDMDERLAADAVLFFLRDFVADPISVLRSREYNDDPMRKFNSIYSEWNDQIINEMGAEKKQLARDIFSIGSILLTCITYDKYIDFLITSGKDLEYKEVRFERKGNSEEVNKCSKFGNWGYFPNDNTFNQNARKGAFGDRRCIEDKFSSFWRYKPSPYKQDFRISKKGSSIDGIFESLSLILYSTNSYGGMIKATFTSAISIIKKVCELQRDIIKNYENKMAYIHVEGVDQEIVLFVLSMCDVMRYSREKTKSKLQTENQEMHDLEIFELMQFIYKVPIMVFEMNPEQAIVRDTVLNRRIYDLNDLNKLILSIKIAKIVDSDLSKPIKYMPIIPKVPLNDFESLRNGVGPIPISALVKSLNSVKNSRMNREKFKFRKRTAFDDATDNFFNRKQAPVLFPDGGYPGSSRASDDLVPILRRHIPYIPGDVEGKSLLQFIKVATAVIDLRRRPIKELPDRDMERTFKSLLLGDRKLHGSKQHLMRKYGLNIDEVIEKYSFFEKENVNIDIKNKVDLGYEDLQLGGYYRNSHYLNNPNNFLIYYFNSVRHANINPNVIHSFIDAERLQKRNEKQSNTAGILEAIKDILKYTAVSIFSELYYHWAKFKYRTRELSYENPMGITIALSEKDKEEILRDRHISLYIEDKLDKIELKRNKDSN
ncbi:signal peptide-containing protein [Cryptosporidium canis]|nr:signal peptide-containing protein [Cryptosporidium canis]